MRRRIAILAAVSLFVATLAPAAVQAQSGQSTPAAGVTPHAMLARPHGQVFECEGHALDQVTPLCYRPQAIRKAYGIDRLIAGGDTGAGRTIVIVDAFDNPYIAHDLAIFDEEFGLPDPVLKVVYPFGKTPFDFGDERMLGWSGEISLDVEWAHAIAPGAAITLVLAKSDRDVDLIAAVKYAVDNNLGDVISQSYGEAERCAAPADVKALHGVYAAAVAKGMSIVVAAGDLGAAGRCASTAFLSTRSVNWPATDPLATSIGGTTLAVDANGAWKSERAWADMFSGCYPAGSLGCSSGGFSILYKKPSFQNGLVSGSGGHRGVPDVAYAAGVDGGVLVHWGVGLQAYRGAAPDSPLYFVYGGTSAGAPQWSGLIALADQLAGRRLGSVNARLYSIAHNRTLYRSAFRDVQSGTNSFAWGDAQGNLLGYVKGYKAGRGWDAVTGLGSPRADVLVPLLAAKPRR